MNLSIVKIVALLGAFMSTEAYAQGYGMPPPYMQGGGQMPWGMQSPEPAAETRAPAPRKEPVAAAVKPAATAVTAQVLPQPQPQVLPGRAVVGSCALPQEGCYWTAGHGGTIVLRVLGVLAVFYVLALLRSRNRSAMRQAEAANRQADIANQQARIANRQAEAALEYRITDRFAKAVEHLGSDQLPVRLGGMYTLARIAEDSPKRDLRTVLNVLCALVRSPPQCGMADTSQDGVRADVQAALDVVMRRLDFLRNNHVADYQINLSRADLSHADLAGTGLIWADLTGANLSGANLSRARMLGANVAGAKFDGTRIDGVDMREVTGLVQAQVDAAVYSADNPPVLPGGFVLRHMPSGEEGESTGTAA
ncbi:MAG: pentapeptide repeat-containing protein [Alphaproteobacteria bacterium]